MNMHMYLACHYRRLAYWILRYIYIYLMLQKFVTKVVKLCLAKEKKKKEQRIHIHI
jgi:hypothetical protein